MVSNYTIRQSPIFLLVMSSLFVLLTIFFRAQSADGIHLIEVATTVAIMATLVAVSYSHSMTVKEDGTLLTRMLFFFKNATPPTDPISIDIKPSWYHNQSRSLVISRGSKSVFSINILDMGLTPDNTARSLVRHIVERRPDVRLSSSVQSLLDNKTDFPGHPTLNS